MMNFKKILSNKRITSAVIAIILVIPVFLIITNGFVYGRAIGYTIFILSSMYATFEFIKHMHMHKVTKIFILFAPLFIMFFDKDFTTISLISHPHNAAALKNMINFYTLILPAIYLTVIMLDPIILNNNNLLKFFFFVLFAVIMPAMFLKIMFILTVIDYKVVIGLVMVAIISDIFAYLGGMLLHKKMPKKFAPNISPKKTWIGFTVGYIMTLIFMVIYILFMPFSNEINNTNHKSLLFISLIIVLPIISPLGDLSFSWFKRDMGIKDYSNIMPGHGGMLDRIDSWIFIFCSFALLYQIFLI